MASFRIKFPEKEEPSVIVLSGARITVGRLPDNTIQIVDRVISSHHAELVVEDGHYRLRDLGSTNGTFVNDQPVTDYHLREACKVAFGTVECEFTLETPDAGDAGVVEALPTRAEVTALKQENEQLTKQVAALREELDALRKVRPMSQEEAALGVPKAEYEKVTADREALKEAQERHHQEIARLKENLALLRRDRENIQRAWEITKAELNAYRPAATVATPSAPAAPTPPAATPVPRATPAPATPTPAQPTAQPTARPQVVKAIPVARPPTAAPPGSNPATATPAARPVPVSRPSVPGTPATPRAVPALGTNAVPAPRVPTAVPKPASGTQKMDPPAAGTAASPASPTSPKPLPKPGGRLGMNLTRPLPTATARPAVPPAEEETKAE